jgi:hypothetical protein
VQGEGARSFGPGHGCGVHCWLARAPRPCVDARRLDTASCAVATGDADLARARVAGELTGLGGATAGGARPKKQGSGRGEVDGSVLKTLFPCAIDMQAAECHAPQAGQATYVFVKIVGAHARVALGAGHFLSAECGRQNGAAHN